MQKSKAAKRDRKFCNEPHCADQCDEEEEEEEETTSSRRAASKKPSGYNWTAMGLLVLFVLPVLFTGVVHVMDYFNPTAAHKLQYRKVLTRCFEAADSSQLPKIDSYLEKYDGRENIMFAKLRRKYPKIPECQ